MPGGDHGLDGRLRGHQRAAHVDVIDPVPRVVGVVLGVEEDLARTTADGVDDDVEAAEALQRLAARHHRLQRGRSCRRPRPGTRHRPRPTRAAVASTDVLGDVHDGDPGAGLGERHGHGRADGATAAGDEGHAAIELEPVPAGPSRLLPGCARLATRHRRAATARVAGRSIIDYRAYRAGRTHPDRAAPLPIEQMFDIPGSDGTMAGCAPPDPAAHQDPLAGFEPPTRDWFDASFAAPTAAQSQGWPAIAAGEHTLICAPTGSGKTLAAFLWCLDRLLAEDAPEDPQRAPAGALRLAAQGARPRRRPQPAGAPGRHRAGRPATAGRRRARYGSACAPGTPRRRSGAPSASIRRTSWSPRPESLYLILTSGAREALHGVRWVIVDEIHALAGTKRGVHLALSLERLETLADRPPQRIGLSATQRPLSAVAAFLGGRAPRPAGRGTTRRRRRGR